MRRLFVVTALVLTTSAHVFADEPPTSAKNDDGHGERVEPVALQITPAPSGLWSMKISNNGSTPIRLAADPRLLSFEIGTTRCALPDDARPSTDEGRELVIPGKRSWSSTFDPLFYCFGAKERAALVKDAQVRAHFGWRMPVAKGKTPPAPAPPFAVTPIGASVGSLAPIKQIDADALATIPETVTVAVKPAPPPGPPPADAPPSPPPPSVYLAVPETMDAAKGDELSTTVSLVNESDRPITLLFRPDMVNFSVSGPNGSVGCGSPRIIGSPMRDLFVTLGVKARTSLQVLFTATCGAGTFDQAGLYRITPRLDTTNASGRTLNVRTWDGVATGKAPLLLRVRQPKRPSVSGPRPALD